MRAILSRLATIARSDTSVLLLGETGVGKEVIADYVTARGPFVALINCRSALSESCSRASSSATSAARYRGDERQARPVRSRAGGHLFSTTSTMCRPRCR